MSHIIGIGGVFLKCQHIEETKRFYTETLELPLEDWGGCSSSGERRKVTRTTSSKRRRPTSAFGLLHSSAFG